MMPYRVLITCLFCLFAVGRSSAQHIEQLQQGRNCSLRGLSVVDNRTAWASGSKGTVAVTTDGGKSWNWQQVKGSEQADFRDIEAFSDKEAIIMSSGTPAVIMRTRDGGASWQTVFRSDDKAYFLDAMDFTPDGKHGFVLGDPIDGKFLLLETLDGGSTWAKFKYLPDALPGEAAFAASGTCLRVDEDGNLYIVTGGTQSRFFIHLSAQNFNPPEKWLKIILPLVHGQASKGAFSISGDGNIMVGGDYQTPKSADAAAAYWFDDGRHTGGKIQSAQIPPRGYQSCAEFLGDMYYLSTGTPGSNITTDGGKNWKPIDTASFNVCRKAKSGNLVLLAGDGGRIGLFKN